MNIKSTTLIISLSLFAQGCVTTSEPPTQGSVIKPEISTYNHANELIKISMTYEPLREHDAQELSQTLRKKGYIVNVTPSSLSISKLRQSYMFIDKKDHKEGAILSGLIIAQLDEEIVVRFNKEPKLRQEARIALLNPKA